MHPSMRVHYLKAAEWEEEWVEATIEIAEMRWRENYKPEVVMADSSDVPPCPFGYSVSKQFTSCSIY
jgi:hypothetical protein